MILHIPRNLGCPSVSYSDAHALLSTVQSVRSSSTIHTHNQYGTIVSLTDYFFVSNDDHYLMNCISFNTYLVDWDVFILFGCAILDTGY